MSTQYQTGDDYTQYQAEVVAGPATLPLLNNSWANAVAAHNAQSQFLANSLASAPVQSGSAVKLPSVAITGADNVKGIPDYTPERYVL